MGSRPTTGISRRALLATAAGAAAATTIPGEARSQTTPPKSGGTLRVAAYINPSSLDPVTGRSGADQAYLFQLYDTLVDFDPATLKARPGLADFSFPTPKTLVLDIKPNILFHDGTPLNADAVKAYFDRAMTSKRSTVIGDFASVASVEVAGPLKVVLNLKQPDTALPLILADRAGMVASPTAFAAAGDDFDRRPVGTGPYKFVSWADAERVVFARNDAYWGKKPYLDGINYRVITDYSAGARSVQAGENDFMWQVPSRLYSLLSRTAGVTVMRYPSVRVMMLSFNYGRPPLDDLRVRQAVNYAIDRVGFARVTTEGTGDVASSFAPTQHWAYDGEGANRYPYDPEKARALLKEAGYANGGPEISIVTAPDQEYRRRFDILAENLQKVGFTVKMIPSNQGVQTFTNERKGEMFLVSWTGRTDLTQTYDRFATYSFYNVSYAISKANPIPNVDELLDATRASEDVAARAAAFKTLMRAEREQALLAPLSVEQVVYMWRNNVKGFTPNLLGKPKLDGMYFDG